MASDGEKPLGAQIVLVEDDEGDVLLVEEAFAFCRRAHRFMVFNKGEEALGFLRKSCESREWRCPDLILLDLNLPGMSGIEVLAQLKTDRRLMTLPVIVLTTSDSERDVKAAYESHANAYLIKPTSLDELAAAARRLEDFWLDLAVLPGP